MGKHGRKRLNWRDRRRIRKAAADAAEYEARTRLIISKSLPVDETAVDLPKIPRQFGGG
jgi:hypothetical protein